ncbi:MAG: pyrroline-5-carboxylate reductase [Lachnospiraceae bacterium]|nr:pyrroline-5-carboxylate reductase [Lachnospiraceae bacterium]MDE7201386.1 pyrroline-5-carboxylate reductase [Lachnospiraceae bacterium]
MKIGFIGLGNMATAMIGGMLGTDAFCTEEIIGSAKTQETADKVSEKYGIATGTDNRETARQADVLILAVKPIFLPEVIAEIKDLIDGEGMLVISIVAGKSIDWMEQEFGKTLRIIRCMPNTPAMVGEGCTCICLKETFSDRGVYAGDQELALKIMNSFGKASILPERLMEAFIGVAGSAPAYVFILIEAMADAAVRAGMPRKQAYEFAAQSVLGSAKMVLETGMHPGELKDMVCSPAGTTIEAVKVLEEKGMRAAVIDAIGACVEKSRNL